MRRLVWVVALLGVLVVTSAGAAEGRGRSRRPPAAPARAPEPGDAVVLRGPRGWAPLLSDREAVHDLLELRVRAGRAIAPDTGFAPLVERRQAVKAGDGTLARVVARHEYGPDGRSVEPCLEVRVLEGPLRDRAGYVLLTHGTLVEPQALERLKVQRREAARRKVTAALKAAENLERSGKTEAALRAYQRVLTEFPGTPQAAVASGRVKALATK
jgi:hypothetical protein